MFVQTQDHEEDEAGDGADDHGADDHGADDHGADDHGVDDHGDDDHGADDHGDDDQGADDHGTDDHGDIYHGKTTPPELEVEALACLPRLKPGLKSMNSIANAGLQDRF